MTDMPDPEKMSKELLEAKAKAAPVVRVDLPDELEAVEYREPTEEELAWTNPKTPRHYKKRVRINCPTGVVIEADIEFEDGEKLENVLRAVLVMESPQIKGSATKGLVFAAISVFHNEIGRVVHSTAQVLIGYPVEEEDIGPANLDLTDVSKDTERRTLFCRRENAGRRIGVKPDLLYNNRDGTQRRSGKSRRLVSHAEEEDRPPLYVSGPRRTVPAGQAARCISEQEGDE